MHYYLVRDITFHDDNSYAEYILVHHDDVLPEYAEEWITMWNCNAMPHELNDGMVIISNEDDPVLIEKGNYILRELEEHEIGVLNELFMDWSWDTISRFVKFKLEEMENENNN